jgi:hypothetical protein
MALAAVSVVHVLQGFSRESGRLLLEFELTPDQLAEIKRHAPDYDGDPCALNEPIEFFVAAFEE